MNQALNDVSVVIATYNGEKYIVKQLESIRNQTRKPDEVIIVDDRSNDNTFKIVKEYISSMLCEIGEYILTTAT